ncbi:MAG TPA: hypothetical protein VGM27_15190 [Acidobacteriaceae bacterium]
MAKIAIRMHRLIGVRVRHLQSRTEDDEEHAQATYQPAPEVESPPVSPRQVHWDNYIAETTYSLKNSTASTTANGDQNRPLS